MFHESPPAGGTGPLLLEAIRQFRHEIGAFRPIPSSSRTLVSRVTPKPSYTRKLVTVLCFLTLVAAGVGIAPQLAGSDKVPAELVGRWTTYDPRYEDRYFELRPDAMILLASVGEGTEYAVRRVQRSQISQGSTYVINAYSERGGEYILTLDYRDAEQTIALGNPAHVLWRRVR
jgi:hypothetical protein